MKKILLLLAFTLSINGLKAQEAADAMRYSLDNLTGTARFRAMSGAFGALGGDFSALNVNPAGSAIFANNQAAISLSSYNINNKSNYFGTKSSENNNTLNLNQAGAVWVFEDNNEKTDWNKFALAINYDNTNSFNNATFSAGINPNNSVANYFASYANGIPLSTITNNSYEFLNYSEQQAFLGYDGYIINPIGGSNNQYESNLSATGNYFQENSTNSRGYNGKLSFNASAAYKDKLYFGLNLNSHFSDYSRRSSFYEDYLDATNHDASAGLQALRFSNELYTYGTGFSFQLGAIAKITAALRLGLSYESPTWYRLNDELTQTLSVRTVEQGSFFVDPNLTIIYPTYKIQTASKYNGSLAYVFGKTAIISVDYSYKDHNNTRIKPSTLLFDQVNSEIKNTFSATNEIRIGGEYRIKQWSLRGGYRFEESPYKNGKTISDLNGYSTGLGYNFGEFKIDLAYSLNKRDYEQAFFSQGLIDTATINSRSDNVTVTVLFQL